MKPRFCLLLAFLAVAAASARPALAATYTVGSGWTCTHRTIQSAVDSARVQPGADVIRVTNTFSYNQQRIEINDTSNLQIEGGYSSCMLATAGAGRTRISGAGGVLDSVLTIVGAGNVTLIGLDITGGDSSGHGGGIEIASNAPNFVTLRNVRVGQNIATNGGGISVRGSENIPSDENVWLVLDADTVIEANGARGNGGGLHCSFANVHVYGRRTSFVYNQAVNGGGVYATDCGIRLEGGTVASNVATDSGGGVHLTRSFLAGWEPETRIGLMWNRAIRFGGALFAVDSIVDLSQAVIDGNSAGGGGGAGWLETRAGNTSFWFYGDDAPSAVECRAEPIACSRISNNVARDAVGAMQNGAAFVLVPAAEDASKVLTFGIDKVSVFGNQGRTLVRSVDGHSSLSLHINGSEVRGNTTGGNLIELMGSQSAAQFEPYRLMLESSTIAANTIGGQSVLYSQAEVSIARSIVWQPGRGILRLDGDLPAPEARYTISSDLQGFAPSPTSMIADPRFVDATVGNLRLSADSPAIDYAPFGGSTADREYKKRIDLPTYPNRYGQYDLGAFERQTDRVICCATIGGD